MKGTQSHLHSIAFSLLFLVFFVGLPFGVIAAPAITQISGTVAHGNSIQIQGTGFGVKSPAKPYFWAPLETSINPSPLGIDTTWDEIGSMAYVSGEGPAGVGALKSTDSGGIWVAMVASTGTFSWAAPGQKMYLYRKVKHNFSIFTPVNFNWKSWRVWGNIVETGAAISSMDGLWNDSLSINSGWTVESGQGLWPLNGQACFGPVNQWNTNEILLRSNTNAVGYGDGFFQYRTNGASCGTVPYEASDGTRHIKLWDGNATPRLQRNYVLHGVQANHTMGANDRYWGNSVYLDTTWARVMIGNAPSFENCTHLEIQIPTVWASNSITVSTNVDSFPVSDTPYLYVFDIDNNVNPTGYPITIGSGGGGDTTPPTSPTNLAATSPSQTSISVTWTASTDAVGVTGYIVERCQGSGCSNFIQVGTPTASPFVDSGLTPNTVYNYHVRARDAANNLSGWSNVVGATTQANTPVTELIIDNTDTNTSQSGSWSPSTNFPGYYGTDYHYSPNATGHWFEWTATTLVAGTYEVYAYWNANTDRPTDVSYLITHSGGTATRNNINQTQNGSQWNLLGTYAFGATGTVRVQSGGTGTEGTVADAIRFVKTNTTPCNTVTTSNFSQSAYNSYGAPYDAFQTSTNLMNTTCTSADTHTINLTTGVTGDTTRIVYTKGYWYDAVTTAWRQYTGTCTGALNGEWCQGSVSATITDANVSTASSANPTYLVGMTCSVQGGGWKCGCRDTSCANFSWQIQGAGM